MGRPARASRRRQERAKLKKKARRERADREIARKKQEMRDAEREDIFLELRPVLEAWEKSAEGRVAAPLPLTEMVVVVGSRERWSIDKIRQVVALAERYVDLHADEATLEARRVQKARENLTVEQRIWSEIMTPAAAPRRRLVKLKGAQG